MLVPFSEGAKGDGGLESVAGLDGGERSSELQMPAGSEQPVDGDGAEGSYLLPYCGLQGQSTVTFQGLHQSGEKGLQALGTDPVAVLPQGFQGRGLPGHSFWAYPTGFDPPDQSEP